MSFIGKILEYAKSLQSGAQTNRVVLLPYRVVQKRIDERWKRVFEEMSKKDSEPNHIQTLTARSFSIKPHTSKCPIDEQLEKCFPKNIPEFY